LFRFTARNHCVSGADTGKSVNENNLWGRQLVAQARKQVQFLSRPTNGEITMTPKDLRTKTVPEMAGMVERRINDILILLEQIDSQSKPQNPDISALFDLSYIISKAYDRAKSSLNELQG